MNVEIRDDRFRDVLGDDAPVEEVAGGFEFTEGARWHQVENRSLRHIGRCPRRAQAAIRAARDRAQ